MEELKHYTQFTQVSSKKKKSSHKTINAWHFVFDLVVINLYPFEKFYNNPKEIECIENMT